MRTVIYTPQGEPLVELVSASYGAIEWAFDRGAATISLPVQGADYLRSRWLLDPRREEVLGCLVGIHFDSTEGLPDWAGVVLSASEQAGVVTLGCEGAQWVLTQLVIRERFTPQGFPRQALRQALDRCATDGYPVVIARESELGHVRQGRPVMPQTLQEYLQVLCRVSGMEWTVVPELRGDRLLLGILLADRLGEDFRDTAEFALGVEVVGTPSVTRDGYGMANEVVAVGKAQKAAQSPIVVEDDPKLVQRWGVRRQRLISLPDVADRERLQAAARAELRRRSRPYRAEAFAVSDARRGPETYRKVRLGNRFGTLRIMGFSYEPAEDVVTLVLRDVSSGVGENE